MLALAIETVFSFLYHQNVSKIAILIYMSRYSQNYEYCMAEAQATFLSQVSFIFVKHMVNLDLCMYCYMKLSKEMFALTEYSFSCS